MAPGRRGPIKRESTTAHGGLATPGASLYSRTVSPKREIETIDLSQPDEDEEELPIFKSNHGLPSFNSSSSARDRDFRSDSGMSISDAFEHVVIINTH